MASVSGLSIFGCCALDHRDHDPLVQYVLYVDPVLSVQHLITKRSASYVGHKFRVHENSSYGSPHTYRVENTSSTTPRTLQLLLRSGLLLVPIAPQASVDLLCNPDWTDAEVYAQSFSQLLPSHHSHCRIDKVTPDWPDNSAVHLTFICDYDSFEPPFDVFDS
eukprot:g22936.t1